jgi:hypothetical protein
VGNKDSNIEVSVLSQESEELTVFVPHFPGLVQTLLYYCLCSSLSWLSTDTSILLPLFKVRNKGSNIEVSVLSQESEEQRQ